MHRSLNMKGTLGPSALGTLRQGVYDGKIAGLYDLEETLGRGHFAVVKLARHVFTGEKVAVKVIDKSKLDEVSKAHLFQEVRCMKLVQHPNVVRLYEVIDTATKLYLILELGDGGDLYDYIMRHDTGLSESVAREYFRQIVRAITYCHQLHVVHRDLKPENVVFFQKLGLVKLTDFGFSNKFCPGQKLETSCGSLAYSAPEILLGDSYDAPAVDVWSLGVILYMLVCGQAPFQEANDSETLTMIMDCKYTVPVHVSQECKDLIARMLVRAPEKRAMLVEISAHPWLATDKKEPLDILPLVSKEQLSEEDHNLIVQKIVNGNIATKEEIQDCLDKNEYNHITATYFLLAERKLRSKRQEFMNKGKRPDNLAVQKNCAAQPTNNSKNPNPCLLAVPRTPGDVPQRSRKCSIVQEDEEEEDMSSCSGREELSAPHNSLNRRGSRSEGRLNLALQERLAESERRKCADEKKSIKSIQLVNIQTIDTRPKTAVEIKTRQYIPASHNNKWKPHIPIPACIPETIQDKVINDMITKTELTPTTIITESSTITIPIVPTSQLSCQSMPKYKTMPSPTRTQTQNLTSPLQLNEIFEEGDCEDSPRSTSRQFVSRNQSRTSYEQRRSKFNKNRTASCSSSDASDDDSENRKKRAHKLNASSKPLPGRRDSHDDSSDSQEPGNGTGAGGNNGAFGGAIIISQNNNQGARDTKGSTNNGGTNEGRKHNLGNNTMLGRRHKASRRRNGETRLRESQSLNRITEVQEDGAHAIAIATNIAGVQSQVVVVPKVKGFGARILQGFAMGSKRPAEEIKKDDKVQHFSRKDATKSANLEDLKLHDFKEEKENCKMIPEKSKKMRLLGKYFTVHKRMFIPIPGLFSRNKLYKAQSCSSLSRDKVTVNNRDDVLKCRQRAVSVIRNSIGSDGDINQNKGLKSDKSIVVNNMCNGLTDMCIHLGQASKCSFC